MHWVRERWWEAESYSLAVPPGTYWFSRQSGTPQLSLQKGSRALPVSVTPEADVNMSPSASQASELCINSPEPVFQNHCLSGEQRNN